MCKGKYVKYLYLNLSLLITVGLQRGLVLEASVCLCEELFIYLSECWMMTRLISFSVIRVFINSNYNWLGIFHPAGLERIEKTIAVVNRWTTAASSSFWSTQSNKEETFPVWFSASHCSSSTIDSTKDLWPCWGGVGGGGWGAVHCSVLLASNSLQPGEATWERSLRCVSCCCF